jgi:cytochrome P450
MGLITELLTQEIQRHPVPLRVMLRLFDKLVPAPLNGRVAIKANAVREVFARPDEFLMGYLNAPKLKLGPFLLGMDPGPTHASEKAQLQAALDASLSEFSAFVAYESDTAAQRLAASFRETGKLDLVSDFVEPVFVRSLAHYFGIPLRGLHTDCVDAEPGVNTLVIIIRKLGSTIASSHPAPFGLEKLATRLAEPFKAHLQDAVRAHRDRSIVGRVEPAPPGVSPLAPDRTVIGHLLAHASFSDGDDGVVRSVGGMLSASAGFPKAFAHVMHELLMRPHELTAFAKAAAASDERTLHAYVKEALRFRPVFPLLVRYCPHSTAVHSADATIPAGSTVPFFPLGAMFDPSSVERPEQFIPGRPDDVYAIFGGAPRACIGRPLMMALFLPMFRALFGSVPEILSAKPGQLRYDGASIDSYELRPG